MPPLARIQSPSAAHMRIDGRPILNFGGSAYLGLANEPEIVDAGIAALRSHGAVCQLPRHYAFETDATADAESTACAYFGTEAAMVFATGYMFGLIVLTGLAAEHDVILLDELAHFALVDGARATGKPILTFRHCDAAHLSERLSHAASFGRPLVATDGMFATFGNSPPLRDYQQLLEPFGGWLVVDESHSFGALGPTGRGACELEGVSGARVVAGGSLGKAFCAQGGIAIGSSAVIDRLRTAPAARGASVGSPAGAAMAAAAMRLVRREPQRLQRLGANSLALRRLLGDLGLSPRPSASPVAAFVHGMAADMQAICAGLWADGIFVILSSYIGAGPEGAIRIAAFADHRPDDFERLSTALARQLDRSPARPRAEHAGTTA